MCHAATNFALARHEKAITQPRDPEAVTDQHLTSAILYYLPLSYSFDFQTLV